MTADVDSSPPAFLAPLFWDVDFAAVEMTRDGDYVLGRILSAGTLDAIRWARARFGDERIRAWIVQHRGRQLSGPQIRYWETIVGLPADLVAEWLAAPERQLWEGATRA
jgi:hypothetical protein